MKSSTDPIVANSDESHERLSSIRPIAPVAATSAVARYDLLEGGEGRAINFRPPRYPSSELGPVGALVEVTLGERVHRCELHDVSQNGLAFEWEGDGFHVGDTITLLTVSFDSHEAYRGEARVGSVRQVAGKQVIGASFLDTLMNVDDVLQLRDVKSWNHAGEGIALRKRPWQVAGHERFKSLVAEMRLFFLDAEQQLGALEASLPWHVAHGEHDSPARAALIERVREEVVEPLVATSNLVNETLQTASHADREALQEYSQRQIQSFLMQAPCMRRAREKPLGYPGDYELMNGLYDNHFSGSTLFAKAINMGFVMTPAGMAVRARKDLIKQQLSERIGRARPVGRPIRILSVAAGPAQEIYELLTERDEVPHPIEIVLFEQDKNALAFSYSRLRRLVAAKWGDRVKVVYLHDSIKRLLRDATLFSGLGEMDVIFSCGLFDYLQHRTAAVLSRNLYRSLAPGGVLLIGNMAPSSPSRWLLELHLDWYLIYREHEQMLAFARDGVPGAQIAILEERTGVNPFVTLMRD